MAGPSAEVTAHIAATHNYISKEVPKTKSKKKSHFTPRQSRLMSDTAIEEPSAKDSLLKYMKVKDVSWREFIIGMAKAYQQKANAKGNAMIKNHLYYF